MNLKSKTIEMHTRTREGQKVELKKKMQLTNTGYYESIELV